MAASMVPRSTSGELELRRRPYRTGGKGIADIAKDVMRDIAELFRTELQLLQAELFEKLRFTTVSLCVIAAGALFLVITIVLLLQTAISGLVVYGMSWPAASLIVAGLTFILGGGLTWYGLSRLSLHHVAPSRTIDQLEKDLNVTNME
jgi:putative superfamily III holin-X